MTTPGPLRSFDPRRVGALERFYALVALYAHVYAVAPEDVRDAVEQRALAMRHSDRWVTEGCDRESPLIAGERAALVRSYAALLAAVDVLP